MDRDFLAFDDESFTPKRHVVVESEEESHADESSGFHDHNDETNEPMHKRRHSRIARVALPPWASRAPYTAKSLAINLHREVEDFVSFISATPEERKAREKLITDLRNSVKAIWPKADLLVFGSYSTGLFLPTSDVDMVVVNTGSASVPALKTLARRISANRMPRPGSLKVIDKARVPIIKFTHGLSNVEVDICHNMESGTVAIDFIREAIAYYKPLRPLVLILKEFLRQRALNEPFTGGLGSYALLLMSVSFLQLRDVNHPVKRNPQTEFGEMLLDFFHLYGKVFNYFTTGISVRDGGSYFDKRTAGYDISRNPNGLCIEDPHETTNDVGKSAYQFFRVRKAFEFAFQTLKGGLRIGSTRTALSMLLNADTYMVRRQRQLASLGHAELAARANAPLKHDDDDGDEPPRKRSHTASNGNGNGKGNNGRKSDAPLLIDLETAAEKDDQAATQKEDGEMVIDLDEDEEGDDSDDGDDGDDGDDDGDDDSDHEEDEVIDLDGEQPGTSTGKGKDKGNGKGKGKGKGKAGRPVSAKTLARAEKHKKNRSKSRAANRKKKAQQAKSKNKKKKNKGKNKGKGKTA